MRTSRAIIYLSLFASLPSIALATDLPKRASGLWETTVTMQKGIPPQKMKECVDEATDAEMMKMATDATTSMGASCSKNDVRKTASGFESKSECSMAGSKIHTTGSFTGDFTTEYKGEVTTTMTPPLFGQPGSKTTITAKRLGPCAADMKPGDIVMANGMKMNTKDAAADTALDPEDLKEMQEAMQEMAKIGK